MTITNLQTVIETAFDNNLASNSENLEAVKTLLASLDSGDLRIASYNDSENKWIVNEWVKKGILLSFRYFDNEIIPSFGNSPFYDKVNLKFQNWTKEDFTKAKIRAVPGSVVRHSAYIGQNTVLMPSFVNLGAYVDDGCMIDTWATVGSCAQIGKNCHISGGAGIGGVLEPLQANPVIIEDNCFIGARSEVAEGVIIGQGSVLSMGVYLGASTKIIDRNTGDTYMGYVPPYSVVVPGSTESSVGDTMLYCAVIVKTTDEKTRSKTSINSLLRDL